MSDQQIKFINEYPSFFTKTSSIELVESGWDRAVEYFLNGLRLGRKELTIGCIKEEYGRLHIYSLEGRDCHDNDVMNLITFTESICQKTCYLCGNSGEICELDNNLIVLCDICANIGQEYIPEPKPHQASTWVIYAHSG